MSAYFWNDGSEDYGYGGAFTGGGAMGPPPGPGTFDAEMMRSLTPPGRRSMYFDNFDPGPGGNWHQTMLSDNLLDDMAYERGIDLPQRRVGNDEFLGQPYGFNYGSDLPDYFTDDYGTRPTLLDSGFPGGMRPTAATTMPSTVHGHATSESWPGWNDSMPEGAVGYVARDEPWSWGRWVSR
jgi:hypothetical protein